VARKLRKLSDKTVTGQERKAQRKKGEKSGASLGKKKQFFCEFLEGAFTGWLWLALALAGWDVSRCLRGKERDGKKRPFESCSSHI